MGFKIAWELPPKVTSTWHKPCFLHKVSDSNKGKRNPENKTERTGVVSHCLIKELVLHSISYSGYSVALKKLSFYFVLLSPCHAEELFLRNKKLQSWLPSEDALSLVKVLKMKISC